MEKQIQLRAGLGPIADLDHLAIIVAILKFKRPTIEPIIRRPRFGDGE